MCQEMKFKKFSQKAWKISEASQELKFLEDYNEPTCSKIVREF